MRGNELGRLKAEKNKAFRRQQSAYQELESTGDHRTQAKKELDVSWQKLQSAKERMDNAYHDNQQTWDRYKSQQESLSRQIEYEKSQADSLHQHMSDAFDRASNEFSYGDKSLAPAYAAEGNRYKAELQSVNAEVKGLVAQSKSLPRPNSSFQSCKASYNTAKSELQSTQNHYSLAKAEHESAKARFRQARREFQQANEAFKARLRKVKAENEHEYEKQRDVARKAGVPESQIDAVKVRYDPLKGKNDVYFGGLGEADGLGHGHAVVDDSGNIEYLRGVTFGDKTKAIVKDSKKRL